MVTFNKTPLGETRCLGNPYFLLTGAYASTFWIHLLILTQPVRLPVVTYHSLCSTCVAYRTPCHSIGHQVLPHPPLIFREAEDFHEVTSILNMCLCSHT